MRTHQLLFTINNEYDTTSFNIQHQAFELKTNYTRRKIRKYQTIEKESIKARYRKTFPIVSLFLKVPDFLHENGLELASEILRSKFALEVLARQDALLRVLDVVGLLALYHPLDPARLHLPLHKSQCRLQVPVQHLNSNPSPLLKLLVTEAQRFNYLIRPI